MKISVIIAVYGAEKYLPRCIRSVLQQTHRDLELILVDDGSPDASGKICDEAAAQDTRVRVVHQKNAGTSAARNAGIAIASGEYLCFADNDDYLHPEQLEFLLSLCDKNHVNMAVCGYKIVSLDGQESPAPLQGLPTEIIDAYQYIERLCTKLQVQYVVPWGKLYHRELFNTTRFPVGALNEDDAIIHTLALGAQRIAVCYEALYYYCDNAGSISRKGIPIQPWINSLPYKEERMQLLAAAGKKPLLYTVQRLLFYDLLLERAKLPAAPENKGFRAQLLRYARSLFIQICKNSAASHREQVQMAGYCLFPQRICGHTHEEYLR